MSRQAVTKHLEVLEQANLVATVGQGRDKLHSRSMGEEMAKPQSIDVSYIATLPFEDLGFAPANKNHGQL